MAIPKYNELYGPFLSAIKGIGCPAKSGDVFLEALKR